MLKDPDLATRLGNRLKVRLVLVGRLCISTFCTVLAPEVLAGRCPHPCNECIKKQIRKVMAELSQRYPREFQEMMGQLRRLKG